MLNPAQAEYINKLRDNEPGIVEAVLRERFKGAGWPEYEVDEAIRIYQKAPAATSFPPIPSSNELVVENKVDTTNVEVKESSSITKSETTKKVITLAIATLSVFVLVAAAYFLVDKYSKPSMVELTDETLLTHLYEKITAIKMTSYDSTFSLGIGEREEGAMAFADLTPVDPAVLAKYQRDYDRIRYIQKIKSTLDETRPLYSSVPTTALYPKTLEEVELVASDPLGQPYLYTRSTDGTAYTLELTMETNEAYEALRGYDSFAYDNFGMEEDTATSTDKKVTLNQDSYISAYGFTDKPTQPKLFGFFDLGEVESIIPNNLLASFTFGGSIDNETNKPADARMRLAGEVSLGDANFAIDLEGIKKNDKYFGIVNKIPTFFSMFSQLRGKWVGFTENDLRNYGYGKIYDEFIPSTENERQLKMAEARATFNKLLQVATKHKVVNITSGAITETVADETLTRYSLKLNKDSLVPFAEEAFAVLKEGKNKDDFSTEALEELITYLKSEDFERSFTYLSDDTAFNIWFDAEGYPVKMEQTVRYVPSAEAPALKGKQINMAFTTLLSGINKKLEVLEPAEYMTFDELMVEITGKTLEEVKIENQQKNISALRNALREYETWASAYPVSLDELLKKRKEVAKKATTATTSAWADDNAFSYSYDDSYMDELPFIKQLPSDVYSNVPYEYKGSGDNYKLTYTINLVPYTSEKNPSNYYFNNNGFNYYSNYDYEYEDIDQTDVVKTLAPKFVDGLNIATKDVLSQANDDKKDQDKDDLADTLEVIFGTDPKITDTDKDGFTDYEEIMTDSNPVGPGKLDYQRSEGWFF